MKKKLMIVLAAVVLLGAGFGIGKVLSGGGSTAAPDEQASTTTTEPQRVSRANATTTVPPGQNEMPEEAVEVGSLSLNMATDTAGKHYLRVGIAVTPKKGAKVSKGEVTAMQDAAIDILSGRSIAGMETAEVREQLKDALFAQFSHVSGNKIDDVFFTEFVTQ